MEKLRIVIANPDGNETGQLRRQLLNLGHLVLWEGNCSSGVSSVIRETNPDVLLLLLGVSGSDWRDDLSLTQEIGQPGSIPLVIAMDRDEPQLAEHARAAGIDGVLVLPTTDAELSWALTAAADRWRDRADLSRLRAQAQRNAALFRLSAELSATLDENQICWRVIESLRDSLGYGFLGLFLLDETTGERVLTATVGWSGAPQSFRLPPGVGLSERPLLDGELHYTSDVTQDSRFIPGLDTGAEVDVPLRSADEVLGVLVAQSERPYSFDQDDFEVLTAAANQAAVAISKARLLARERRRADELDALRKTITDISSEIELPILLEEILKRAALLLKATGGDLGLFDTEHQEIEIVVSHNMGKDYAGTRQALGEGAMGRVAATGEPLIVTDYHNWADRSPQYGDIAWHASVAAPMLVNEHLVGVIGIVDADPSRQFTTSDVRLLELFAQQSAIAVEKARLIDESRRQTQELAALYDTALAVGGVLEIEELLVRLHKQVQALMNPASFEVVLFHDDTQEIEIMLAMEANEPLPNVMDVRAPLDAAGLTGWVIQTRKPFLVRDLQAEQLPVEPKQITLSARSWLGVPLIAREHLIGVISVQSLRADAFDAGDRRLLESLSAPVAIAIENAQLYALQRRQADELARLHRASATLFLPATTDLPSLAQNIVEAVLREFDQANCSLLLLDPDTGALRRVGAAGPYVAQVIQARLTLDGRGLVPLAARSRQIINIPDVSANPNYVENWDQARSEMAVPLVVGDRVIGVLDVQSNERAAFGHNEERLLTTFAERAALALENALLYQETAKRAEEMASLYAVGLATVSSLSLDDVLTTIYEQCKSVLPCETFYVALHRPGEQLISFPIFIHYSERIDVGGLEFASSNGSTAHIIRQRTALVLDARSTYKDNSPVRPVTMADAPPASYLGVPLLFRGDVIGVLSVQSSDPAAYREDHVRLLATIAAQAAVAIENARYYEAIQDYADSLQRAANEKEQLLEQVQRHAETLELEVAARTAEIFAEKVKTEAVLKSAGDAIVLAGPDCRITYVNDAFITLTGYAPEDAVDREIKEIFNTERVPAANRADLEKALAEGGPWRGDVLTVCRDHHMIETEMTLAPVRDAERRILSFVGSLRDVSQTRALERAKSEFLANVSHQLRTPITNLKTYSYLLGNGSQEKQARYIDIVATQVDKLTHLVQDVLEIAELDVGPIVAEWQPVWPSELVNSIVQGYQAKAEALGLMLRTELPAEPLPPVLGSALRLGQALNQVVENALQYTTEGEVVVGGRLDGTGASARQEVVIWVSDTGPGIPSDEQGFLFDRFFRGKAAEPGHIVGTGLGLSVASVIIEAHRGTIEVQSALGEGSTIKMRLPIPD